MKYFNKIAGISLLIGFFSFSMEAQVSVGTNTPTDKAVLEVSSQVDGTGPYKGLMPPRVPTEADRDAIPTTSTDKGLLVYVKDTGCLDMYNGTSWVHIKCKP